MHIMEEENGKAPGDAAELPETPADLPKKGIADVTISKKADSTEEEKAPESPKVNGVCEEVKTEEVEVKEEGNAIETEDKKEPPEEKEGWFGFYF